MEDTILDDGDLANLLIDGGTLEGNSQQVVHLALLHQLKHDPRGSKHDQEDQDNRNLTQDKQESFMNPNMNQESQENIINSNMIQGNQENFIDPNIIQEDQVNTSVSQDQDSRNMTQDKQEAFMNPNMNQESQENIINRNMIQGNQENFRNSNTTQENQVNTFVAQDQDNRNMTQDKQEGFMNPNMNQESQENIINRNMIQGYQENFINPNKTQENQVNTSVAPASLPVKRKRGRPRKIPGSETSKTVKGPKVKPTAKSEKLSVGNVFSGVLTATFDAGYMLTVPAGNDGTVSRGLVFNPGASLPISPVNDIVPQLPMLKRDEVPIPTPTQRGRKKGVPIKALQKNEPVISSKVTLADSLTEGLSSKLDSSQLNTMTRMLNDANHALLNVPHASTILQGAVAKPKPIPLYASHPSQTAVKYAQAGQMSDVRPVSKDGLSLARKIILALEQRTEKATAAASGKEDSHQMEGSPLLIIQAPEQQTAKASAAASRKEDSHRTEGSSVDVSQTEMSEMILMGTNVADGTHVLKEAPSLIMQASEEQTEKAVTAASGKEDSHRMEGLSFDVSRTETSEMIFMGTKIVDGTHVETSDSEPVIMVGPSDPSDVLNEVPSLIIQASEHQTGKAGDAIREREDAHRMEGLQIDVSQTKMTEMIFMRTEIVDATQVETSDTEPVINDGPSDPSDVLNEAPSVIIQASEHQTEKAADAVSEREGAHRVEGSSIDVSRTETPEMISMGTKIVDGTHVETSDTEPVIKDGPSDLLDVLSEAPSVIIQASEHQTERTADTLSEREDAHGMEGSSVAENTDMILMGSNIVDGTHVESSGTEPVIKNGPSDLSDALNKAPSVIIQASEHQNEKAADALSEREDAHAMEGSSVDVSTTGNTDMILMGSKIVDGAPDPTGQKPQLHTQT